MTAMSCARPKHCGSGQTKFLVQPESRHAQDVLVMFDLSTAFYLCGLSCGATTTSEDGMTVVVHFVYELCEARWVAVVLDVLS